MKFRKITAAFAAAALALSFGGCLKYQGDILNSTTAPDGTASGDASDIYQNPTDVPNSSADITDANGSIISEDGTTGNQAVTPTPNGSETTTAGNSAVTPDKTNTDTTKPSTSGTVTGLDVLKSGNFYWKGRMQDEDGTITDTEMASTKDSLYMATNLGGADVAILIKGSNTYLIYPKIKGYMNMKTLMSLSGMDDDFFDTSAIDFSNLGNLEDATSTKQTTFNNKNCTDYVFTSNGATTELFMSGSSFVGMRSTDSSGKVLTAMYVDYLTGTVPADKSAPPAGYTEYSGVKALSFMTALTQDMDIDTTE